MPNFSSLVLRKKIKRFCRVIFVATVMPLGAVYAQLLEDQIDKGFRSGLIQSVEFGQRAVVESIAVQVDGMIIVGGNFIKVHDVERIGLARLAENGELDSSFNPVLDGAVTSIVVQNDDKILIGGQFNQVNGFSRLGLARLNPNGSLDESFDAGFDRSGVVSIAIQNDNKIVVIGAFQQVEDSVQRELARFNPDGSLDSTLPSRPGLGFANALEIQRDGGILIGGMILGAGSNFPEHLMRFNSDGSFDQSFNANIQSFGGSVRAIKSLESGKILIGGSFSQPSGNRNVELLNPDGSPSSGFSASTGPVEAIELFDENRFLIAGSVATENGITIDNLIRLELNGSLDLGFRPEINDEVRVIKKLDSGKILIGGLFSFFESSAEKRISKIARLGAEPSPQISNSELCIPISTRDGKISVVCL